MGFWCSSSQAAGTWQKLLRERTGQVLGNWTQKEGQLSITYQCMEFNFKKSTAESQLPKYQHLVKV